MTESLIEALVLALALSLDIVVAFFGYGISKIKIPFKTALFITFINALVLGVFVAVGYFLGGVISLTFAKWLSFSLLLLVGIIKLFGELLKMWLTKRTNKPVKLKVFNFQLMLNVLTDSANADVDKDKVLSILEALSVSFIISLDEIGVGLSVGVSSAYPYFIIIINVVTCIIALFTGLFIGKKVSKLTKMNLSWLGGLVLIILAVTKLFF